MLERTQRAGGQLKGTAGRGTTSCWKISRPRSQLAETCCTAISNQQQRTRQRHQATHGRSPGHRRSGQHRSYRLILTTNFDRLFEIALAEVGVHPQVSPGPGNHRHGAPAARSGNRDQAARRLPRTSMRCAIRQLNWPPMTPRCKPFSAGYSTNTADHPRLVRRMGHCARPGHRKQPVTPLPHLLGGLPREPLCVSTATAQQPRGAPHPHRER